MREKSVRLPLWLRFRIFCSLPADLRWGNAPKGSLADTAHRGSNRNRRRCRLQAVEKPHA